MTTVTNIATQLQDELNLTTNDINLTKTEYLIDNAIVYVNSETGHSIAALSGAAESKSLIGTDAEILAVKTASTLLLIAYKDTGKNVGVGSISLSVLTESSRYKIYTRFLDSSLDRVRGRTIVRT